jgi:DNA polymerase family A
MFGLPFREVWCLDFEYISKAGHRPIPVCLVARELGSNRLLRLWQDELTSSPPFRTDDQAVFVAYSAPAELSCFLALGWPLPQRIIDLLVEFRAKTNGISLTTKRDLLGALAYHGIPGITSEEKTSMRDLVLRGGPWSETERRNILEYCQTDVDVLAPLLERLLANLRANPQGLGQALLRGRYTAAVARMEQAGIPIDVGTLEKLRARWDEIKLGLIEDVDRQYGVFEDATFKAGLFASWLANEGMEWPLTSTGRLRLDEDTFRDMAKTYPRIAPLKELRASLSQLRLERVAVGPDGRNRVSLFPFTARTGRNAPPSTEFIFGPAVWLRGLIKPTEGRALAYIDWSSQEVAVAAVLSGDRALMTAIESGDPYIAFAKRAGLAPSDATKHTHKDVRDMCKVAVLGTNYGMGVQALAQQTGLSPLDAKDVLRRLVKAYPVFWEWAEHQIDAGFLTKQLVTEFGWPIHVGESAKPTSLRNYKVQANGAEMLRLACCLSTEAGVQVDAPVHDALLIEDRTEDIDGTVDVTRKAMAEASRAVLRGFEVETDVAIVRYPDRYMDARGADMWARISKLLNGSAG